jgi:hypothetical protein
VRVIVFTMKTLAEIEAAVESLPPEKKEELLRFLMLQLREETMTRSRPAVLTHSKRGFPTSKGRESFTSTDVARIEAESDAIL